MTSRREMILWGGALASTGLAANAGFEASADADAPAVRLATPEELRRDYQHMVDFGPRLPGHPNHVRFVQWLSGEFQQAGLTLGPCDEYALTRWDPLDFGLEVQIGSSFVNVPKTAYYVRSQSTGAAGVSGPLVYGGEIQKDGSTSLGNLPKGSIVVLDGKLPSASWRQLTDPIYVHAPAHSRDEQLDRPYRRLWQTPQYPLAGLLGQGVAGVVIIMDVSSDMLGGNFSPHATREKQPLPALFVGQDVGADLRQQAKAGVNARLTLSANWVDCTVPSVTAVLTGTSDELMIIDTHTDGQNFIEENGCLCLLQLARHFASLPKRQRLRRTLVFAGWPGHMSGALPECPGWIRAHPDLVKRAAAALTIEHLGAPEWEDIAGRGYAPTGRNEWMNLPCTAGVLSDLTIAAVKQYDLRYHSIQRGPGISTGSVFHGTGVPHIGVIGGPNYLLGIAPNGHMDKLDAELAARQTQMLADLIKRIDRVSMQQLRATDNSLGAQPVVGADVSRSAACTTA